MFLILPAVNVILWLDFLVLAFLLYVFNTSRRIAFGWDIAATTERQYQLEKKSSLVAVIVKFAFLLKLILFPWFAHVMDALAAKLPGAMCATGVLSASPYGYPLLGVRILTIFGFGLWLIIHYFDSQHPEYPYTRTKFKLFLGLLLIFILEGILEFNMFLDLDPKRVTSCCGSLFGSRLTTDGSLLSLISPDTAWIFFYLSFLGLMAAYIKPNRIVTGIFNTAFLISAVMSLIYFFSPYVYELPSP